MVIPCIFKQITMFITLFSVATARRLELGPRWLIHNYYRPMGQGWIHPQIQIKIPNVTSRYKWSKIWIDNEYVDFISNVKNVIRFVVTICADMCRFLSDRAWIRHVVGTFILYVVRSFYGRCCLNLLTKEFLCC